MKSGFKKFGPWSIFTMMVIASSCGGGGGSGGGGSSSSNSAEVLSSLTTGYTVPKSISAIPADKDGSFAPTAARSVPRKLDGLRQALNSSGETDYDRAGNLELKVSEPALDQFEIIEVILGTLRQTNYWDSSVINKGAYKTLVRWEETGDGPEYQNWIINSKMIVLDGADVNRVRFWIEGDGIKGKIDIFTAPSSSNIYGEWRLDVYLQQAGESGDSGSFTASSELQSDGYVKLSINQDTGWNSKGILYLKNGEGQGIVQYPDEDQCTDWPCDPPNLEVKMAYNSDYAIIQKASQDPRCKDRNSFSDIYMDYSLFDSSGKNVNKSKVYSFPLKYQGEWYFYGGWEGRQQLWGENASDIPLNSVLEHGDYDNNTTFNLTSRIKGILTKKSGTDITSDLALIGTDVLQTSLWQGSYYFVLAYDGSAWKHCDEWNYDESDGSCTDYNGDLAFQTLTDAISIADTDGIYSAHGNLSRRVQVVDYSDYSWQNLISSAANATDFTSSLDQDKAYRVYIEKMLYLIQDGGVVKSCAPTASDFAADPWNPVTSANKTTICTTNFDWGSLAQSWGNSSHHFWTNGGTQYIAKVDDTDDTTDLLELVKTSTEVIKSEVVNGLTKVDWSGTTGDSYTFDSSNQLKLGTDVVTEWTDRLFDDQGNEYYWEYSADGDWDVMTYFTYASDPGISGVSIGDDVVFDSPLVFDSVSAKNVAGDTVTLGNLRYDGYFMGLPDVWSMLEENRNSDSDAGLTPSQKARIVNIAVGTAVTDSEGDSYKIKPRYGIRLLDDVEVANCSSNNVSVPSDLSLADVPTFKDPELDDEPQIDEVIVIEGEFVDEL